MAMERRKRRLSQTNTSTIGGSSPSKSSTSTIRQTKIDAFVQPVEQTTVPMDVESDSEDIDIEDDFDLGLSITGDKEDEFSDDFDLGLSEPKETSLSDYHYDNRVTQGHLQKERRKVVIKEEAAEDVNPKRKPWLLNPRDNKGHPKGHVDYDPTKLYIPPSEMDKLTPAKKDYWAIKKEHFDEIVFYQQGDFYNIFANDADIGVELGLVYNRKLDSVGFNRKSYLTWARKFAAHGYKVLKVDQISTAVTKTEKKKKSASKKKSEERAITEILTHGTIRDLDLVDDTGARYLFSIYEYTDPDLSFSVSFLDSLTLEFGFYFFQDDAQLTQLETILLQLQPKEVLYEKKNLSKNALSLMKRILANPMITLRDFPGRDDSIYYINSNSYFSDDSNDDISSWPAAMKSAVQENPLIVPSIAAILMYTEELKFDKKFFRKAHYYQYNLNQDSKYLVLDSVTLENLEILHNNDTHTDDGSLFYLLNHCSSDFGKRLLKRWICHPLRDLNEINERLDAVEYLINNSSVRENLRYHLNSVRDLERMMGRIISQSSSVANFIGFFEDFKKLLGVLEETRESLDNTETSSRLVNSVIFSHPDMTDMFKVFNFKIVDDNIVPTKGSHEKYDAVSERVDEIKEKLEDYLQDQRNKTGISNMTYHHAARERYTLKISMKDYKPSLIPKDYENCGKTKTQMRFVTKKLEYLKLTLGEAEDDLQNFTTNIFWHYQAQFDDYSDKCKEVLSLLSMLDCLLSFAHFAAFQDGLMCRPQFSRDEEQFIHAKSLRHPYVHPQTNCSFIPNDIMIGKSTPAFLLITGPNMGGKSTLLRQVCVSVIMAHSGCFVTAESFHLTPVDQIFTRLGARDKIFAGQSTFMVEMEECAKVLNLATKDSLVILDELGRGTSTHDGYAIAYGVSKELLDIGARTLFSTHYHKLTDELSGDHRVALGHLGSQKDNGTVIFLYKLLEGNCSKSFGMEVAAMANIPPRVIQIAEIKSEELERDSNKGTSDKMTDIFTQLFGSNKPSGEEIKQLWEELNTMDL